jgi:hypothetical protein
MHATKPSHNVSLLHSIMTITNGVIILPFNGAVNKSEDERKTSQISQKAAIHGKIENTEPCRSLYLSGTKTGFQVDDRRTILMRLIGARNKFNSIATVRIIINNHVSWNGQVYFMEIARRSSVKLDFLTCAIFT